MKDRAQAVGLFRYSLVREAADAAVSSRQRGEWVRQLAAQTHLGPDGDRVRVSRNTLDRWVRAYRAGGFEALVPVARHVEARTPGVLLELAEALRIEEPARTARQIARVVTESKGWSPSARTIQRHLARAGLPWRGAETPRAFGRFEAKEPNELWTGDALHGPVVAGHKKMLRSVAVDGATVVGAAAAHGYSRAEFYLVQAAFAERGMAGLFDGQRGRKGPTKVTTEIAEFLRDAPVERSGAELAREVEERFGVSLHRRTAERQRRT